MEVRKIFLLFNLIFVIINLLFGLVDRYLIENKEFGFCNMLVFLECFVLCEKSIFLFYFEV